MEKTHLLLMLFLTIVCVGCKVSNASDYKNVETCVEGYTNAEDENGYLIINCAKGEPVSSRRYEYLMSCDKGYNSCGDRQYIRAKDKDGYLLVNRETGEPVFPQRYKSLSPMCVHGFYLGNDNAGRSLVSCEIGGVNSRHYDNIDNCDGEYARARDKDGFFFVECKTGNPAFTQRYKSLSDCDHKYETAFVEYRDITGYAVVNCKTGQLVSKRRYKSPSDCKWGYAPAKDKDGLFLVECATGKPAFSERFIEGINKKRLYSMNKCDDFYNGIAFMLIKAELQDWKDMNGDPGYVLTYQVFDCKTGVLGKVETDR